MPSIINATTTNGVAVSGDNSGALALQTNNGTTAITIDTSQNITYVGNLTGGTGVVNLGSGQFYKDANGNIGVGSSSPSAKLHVYSTGSQPANFYADNYYYLNIVGNAATSGVSGAAISAKDSGGTSTYLYLTNSAGTGGINVSNNYPLVFSTNNTERLRINTNGNLALQGGTTTATGVGVTFPSTQSASSNANCLDDYEEGSYSPTDTSSGGLNLSTVTVNYIKIGRQVWCSVDGYYPSTSDGNYASFTLPFTASAISGGGVLTHGGSTAGTRFIVASAATNRVSIYPSTGNTPATNAQMSFSTIYGGFTYIAAA